MLAFNAFDPYALLSEQTPEDAKPANLAKVHTADPVPSLASLASLAEREPQSQSVPTATPSNWSADDWLDYFEERAAIGEYDGGLSRAEAEAQAFECSVSQWMIEQSPTQTDAAICPHCSRRNDATCRDSIATGNGIWLHGDCNAEWYRSLRQQAASELRLLLNKPNIALMEN